MTKQINTLPKDIYELFTGPHTVTKENIDKFKESVAQSVLESLERAGTDEPFRLRMSNIGTKDRKLWYDSRSQQATNFKPKDHIKFLFGHILEQLIIFLAREAGHEVTDEQKEVVVDGIEGHLDCYIDNTLCDVKSASTFAFRKFTSGDYFSDDPFGYLFQLSGYRHGDGDKSEEIAWVVMDKQHGDIAVISKHELELPDVEKRIKHVKSILEADEPPDEYCYTPTTEDNGNEELPKGCSWCQHKTKCWPGMRTFMYSNGPKSFVKLAKLPRVTEVMNAQ